MSPNTQAGSPRKGAAVQRYADATGRWSAIGLGASIPVTVVLNNVLLAVAVLAWLLSDAEKRTAFRQPIAVAALALFALLVVGTVYGAADESVALLHLRKYADLVLIPVFLSLFHDARSRRLGIHGFAISLACILLLSYLLKLGVPLALPSVQGNADYPVVFKAHLTHNILMAFAVFLFAWLASSTASRWQRWAWGTCAALAFINVTMMVAGATGYLILAALITFFGYRCIGWRGLGAAALTISLTVAVLMATTNPFQQRVAKVAQELRDWHPDQPAATSTGWRLEFYRTTLSIIADHPLTGVGTGGFAQTYAEKVKDTGRTPTQNPHNEFLLMWTQLGVVGLAVFIWLFSRQWRLAAHLPTRLERELAYGLVITMVIGCMLNSLLLDHTEGLFYAWLTGVLYGGLKWGEAKHDTAPDRG